MKEKERTPKQIATAVEKTINEIRRVVIALPVMKGKEWFNEEMFDEIGFDNLIETTCLKYNTNETHIRNIAGFEKKAELVE